MRFALQGFQGARLASSVAISLRHHEDPSFPIAWVPTLESDSASAGSREFALEILLIFLALKRATGCNDGMFNSMAAEHSPASSIEQFGAAKPGTPHFLKLQF